MRDRHVSTPIPHPTGHPVAPRRHVLADHAGHGGVTVAAIGPSAGHESADPGLFALADLLLATQGTPERHGGVVMWREGGLVWLQLPVRPRGVVLESSPDPRALARLPAAADPGTDRLAWATVDARTGQIAARAFTADGREHDGAAVRGAMTLTSRLRQPLLVRFGTGSVIFTRPAPRGQVEVGARVGPPRGGPLERTGDA